MLARGGVDSGLHLLIHAVISTYEAAVDWLEEGSDALSNLLFDEHPLDKSRAAAGVPAAQGAVRAAPRHRADADGAGRPGAGPAAGSRRAGPIASARRTGAGSCSTSTTTGWPTPRTGYAETLASVFDTSLALNDLRLNQTMKKLTGWAAIIAVPTLVTSFVGMNVAFPLEGTVAGFWLYLLVMVASGLALYAVFRTREWV